MGYTPHSPRRGYASESKAMGRFVATMMEEARLMSERSFKVYADVEGASQIHTTLAAAGLARAQAKAGNELAPAGGSSKGDARVKHRRSCGGWKHAL